MQTCDDLGLSYEKRDGKLRIAGYNPEFNKFKMTGDDRLDKCFPFLFNAQKDYSFLKVMADADFVAIRCWHKDHPEMVFAIGIGKSEPYYETILDEEPKTDPAYTVQYWYEPDSNEDKILYRISLNNPYAAAIEAVKEVLLIDFENKDFRK